MYRVIAYIDGFNLYYGIKQKGWRRFYWLNVEALSRSLLAHDQELRATKYFTALMSSTPSDPDKSRRQTTYIEALETLPDLQVFFGHFLAKPMKCLKCGVTWTSYEEKRTDVNIAIEMLNDAYQNRFDTALLISGDSDLAGMVEMIRHLFPQKRIVVAFPPARNSNELRKVVNYAFTIGRDKLVASQFPDAVTKPDGFTLHRPQRWR